MDVGTRATLSGGIILFSAFAALFVQFALVKNPDAMEAELTAREEAIGVVARTSLAWWAAATRTAYPWVLSAQRFGEVHDQRELPQALRRSLL